MQQPQNIKVEGRTFELTLVKAAESLGVPTDRVDYRIVSGRKHGILAFLLGRRNIQIEAWVKTAGNQRAGRPLGEITGFEIILEDHGVIGSRGWYWGWYRCGCW